MLWFLSPVPSHLSEDWENDDTCWEWGLLFVCRQDTKRFNITIEGGSITEAVEETYTAREIDIPAGLPSDRPGISLKDAAATALANNMPSHITPMICYTVENSRSRLNGRAVWEFSFGTDSGSLYTYVIDGLTGDLIEITDFEGNQVDPSDLQGQDAQDVSAGTAPEIIGQLASLLDSGNVTDAVNLMASDKIANEQNKEMWVGSFSAIDSIEIVGIETAFPENWTAVHEYYKVTLDVALQSGAQPGLWEDGEIIRWINLILEDGQWKINEISMNP